MTIKHVPELRAGMCDVSPHATDVRDVEKLGGNREAVVVHRSGDIESMGLRAAARTSLKTVSSISSGNRPRGDETLIWLRALLRRASLHCTLPPPPLSGSALGRML